MFPVLNQKQNMGRAHASSDGHKKRYPIYRISFLMRKKRLELSQDSGNAVNTRLFIYSFCRVIKRVIKAVYVFIRSSI